MDYHEAFNRLANHANQPSNDQIAPEESFIFSLWTANRERQFPNVKQLSEDVIRSLEVVNISLNGPQPSASFSKERAIDRGLVQVVSSLLAAGQKYALLWHDHSLFSPTELRQLNLCLWQISSAWGAIMDGDIDSLHEYLYLEQYTTGL